MPHPDTASALRRVHPDRVREAFGPMLSDATVARLRTCHRLHPRLSARLATPAIGRSVGAPDDGTGRFVDPERAALHAGALLYGPALRATVAGPAVAALARAIGGDAFAFGLRGGDGGPARRPASDLARAIREDGLACLGYWLREQPAHLARAVLLALPPGTAAESPPADPALAAAAAAVMGRVVEALGETDA